MSVESHGADRRKAAAGFVNRTGIIGAQVFNRLSFYGAPTAFIESYGSFFREDRIWNNDRSRHGLLESSEAITPSATIRGGWLLSGAVTHSYFAFDPALYSGLTVQRPFLRMCRGASVRERGDQLWASSGPEQG